MGLSLHLLDKRRQFTTDDRSPQISITCPSRKRLDYHTYKGSRLIVMKRAFQITLQKHKTIGAIENLAPQPKKITNYKLRKYDHHSASVQPMKKTCKKCNQLNHFMKVCTSREVIAVDIGEKGSSSMKQLFIGLLEVGNNQDSWLKEYLIAHGNKKKIIQFKLDSGAQAKILSINIAKALSDENSSSQTKLVSYGGNCICNYGITTLSLVNN